MLRKTLSARAADNDASIRQNATNNRFIHKSCSAQGLRRSRSGKIQHRRRREQGFGVVVLRAIKNVVAASPARLCGRPASPRRDRDLLDGREIMADEQAGEAILQLEPLEQFQHLGLDGHVESRDGSSATTKAGWRTMARAIAIRCR